MSHAIGTLYVADKILTSIQETTGVRIDVERRLLARCYALVHDVPHIAYGHTLEDELGYYTSHDANEQRLIRLFDSEKSKVGALLKGTGFGRQVLECLLRPGTTLRDMYVNVADVVTGATGADVLDYIDRDAYFCGLEHRIDSALYRRFRFARIGNGHTDDQYLVTQLYGTHGFRLDAEFALESVLMERFALFLKVYTHPAKVAAGAMLGKGLAPALLGPRKPDITQEQLEWLGDMELLFMLRGSRRELTREMARRVLARRLFIPAFRARALRPEDIGSADYRTRSQDLTNKGVLDPRGRQTLEAELARRSGLNSSEVIVYLAGRPPGLQKVTQYVNEQPGVTMRRDEFHHGSIIQRHMRLWNIYVFVSDTASAGSIAKLGQVAQVMFSLPNELSLDRRQRVLFE